MAWSSFFFYRGPQKDRETEKRVRHVLVGGFNPSEKYEFVSWDYYSQYLEK
jgi:hypothetical protein